MYYTYIVILTVSLSKDFHGNVYNHTLLYSIFIASNGNNGKAYLFDLLIKLDTCYDRNILTAVHTEQPTHKSTRKSKT